MTHLLAHDLDSLQRVMDAWHEPRSHARRVLRHVYGSHGGPPWAADGISQSLAAQLREAATPAPAVIARRVESQDGTVRLLLSLRRGGSVEAVMMPSYREGEAWACISSQVGCAMSCDFCASTRNGLERNLEVAEIVIQFLAIGRVAAERNRAIRRLVFMGMGEPMHNLEAVMAAIHRIAHPVMGGLGWRRITVSTVGVVPGIERLAEADLGVHLAVSLHAPDDETRRKIVPTTKRYTVRDIMRAARDYQRRTKRIVNIEYCLLASVNDSDAHADALAELMDGFRAHVNVIPYNPIGPGLSGTVYERPSQAAIDRFVERLRGGDVVAHVRDTRGEDVDAACGQLRQRETKSADHSGARQPGLA